MAGVDGAVGVLDDNAMNGKIDVVDFSDGKILSEGGFCNFLDLRDGESTMEADGVFEWFCDKPLIDGSFRGSAKTRVLEMEPVLVAGLDDQFFLAEALNPAIEDFMLDVE